MVMVNVTRCLRSLSKTASIVTSAESLVYNKHLAAHEFIMEGVENHTKSIIAIDGLTKAEMSGEQFISLVGKMANKFKSVGLGPGDHVAIVGLNHLNYLPAKLGIIATGAVPVLFNPLYTVQEFAKLMEISQCNYAIGHMCSNSHLEKLNETHKFTLLPQLETLQEWSKGESTICPEFNGNTSSTSMMMFSSGTTGLPKSVELSHENLNSQLACLDVSSKLDQIAPKGITPITVEFLPEFHAYGSIITHYATMKGFKRVMLPIFAPDLFLQCLHDYKAHCTTMVPPVMLMLSKMDIVPNYDLSSLRLIVIGAAPLDPQLEKAVHARLLECNPSINLRICQGYGCTETSGVSMFSRPYHPYKPGTVGPVLAGQEVKLLKEDGQIAGPHEQGEIYIRGPQIMKGYYKNDRANEETFEDGWLKTGDIAYYDEDKDFFIVDRLKEFIKVKGFQVAPAELEAILITHKNITDAAVIGIPNERHGEVPKAYVCLPYGVKMTEDEVKEFVSSQVSDYKCLGEVEFVKIIPKLPSGKIQRRVLREKHAKMMASKEIEPK